MSFDGFPPGRVAYTRIPEPLFSELLPQIDHLGELKVTLYALWKLAHMEGDLRFLREADFLADDRFTSGLAAEPEDIESALSEALGRAVKRGTLLKVDDPRGEVDPPLYFVNTPKGRAAVQAIQQGEWRPQPGDSASPVLRPTPPNIYRLYEENIGPLTPMIAEALQDADESYPLFWIEEAIQIAVKNNARNWRYVEAVLERWQKEGRYEREDRRDSEEDRKRYVEGKYADLIE